jgi:hypothetical protein
LGIARILWVENLSPEGFGDEANFLHAGRQNSVVKGMIFSSHRSNLY